MNPLNSGINPQMMQNIQQLKGMMQQFKTMQNPNAVFQTMAQNNPQMQQVLQMCQGKNPKDVFYSMCQQQGVNPEQILNMLKS